MGAKLGLGFRFQTAVTDLVWPSWISNCAEVGFAEALR
jgi:hypothetical protein